MINISFYVLNVLKKYILCKLCIAVVLTAWPPCIWDV